MIVSTMTPEEVYRELDRDRDNLSRWWLRKRQEIAKRALKCTKFPMTTWLEWISPRKNRYLVFNILLKRKFDKGNASGFIALQRTEYGTATYTSWVNWQYHTTRNVYLPHLYMRYSQRCNVMKTGTDLIKHSRKACCLARTPQATFLSATPSSRMTWQLACSEKSSRRIRKRHCAWRASSMS